jgi:hypothetical protein
MLQVFRNRRWTVVVGYVFVCLLQWSAVPVSLLASFDVMTRFVPVQVLNDITYTSSCAQNNTQTRYFVLASAFTDAACFIREILISADMNGDHAHFYLRKVIANCAIVYLTPDEANGRASVEGFFVCLSIRRPISI